MGLTRANPALEGRWKSRNEQLSSLGEYHETNASFVSSQQKREKEGKDMSQRPFSVYLAWADDQPMPPIDDDDDSGGDEE